MVRLSFGGRTVDTRLSLREIVNRLHRSIELLNSLVKRHAASVEPVQRADIERQIIESECSLSDVFDCIKIILSPESQKITGEIFNIGGC